MRDKKLNFIRSVFFQKCQVLSHHSLMPSSFPVIYWTTCCTFQTFFLKTKISISQGTNYKFAFCYQFDICVMLKKIANCNEGNAAVRRDARHGEGCRTLMRHGSGWYNFNVCYFLNGVWDGIWRGNLSRGDSINATCLHSLLLSF